jgi:flagellar hook-associated protein 2
MVNAIGSNNNLSTYFTNLIGNLMTIERQPLDQLTAQRDQVNITRSVYVDLKTQIDSVRNALGALTSSSPFFSLTAGRTTSVTNAPDGATVLSASASSNAVAGNYDINIKTLALAERQQSTITFTSSDSALGLTSDILLGGSGDDSRAVTVTKGSNILSTGLGTVKNGQHELGTDTYSVETRMDSGKLQFRLKDGDNNVVSVVDGNGSLSSGWQSLADGSRSFDTGRGMVLTFSSDAETNVGTALNASYTAGGTKITIAKEDSLVDVAQKINSAIQPDGHAVQATVIGNKLVFSSAQTGDNHKMIFTDVANAFGFTKLQDARNADFTVNGIHVISQSNSNMTNVVNGVSLNLASDAVATKIDSVTGLPVETGRNATLVVTSNTTNAHNAINDFISEFNQLQTFLAAKTGVTQNADNTFTRGALADDGSFSDLRSNLFTNIVNRVSSGGIYSSLSDIGISIDDNMQLSVSDSTKLDSALTDHMGDVNKMMDSVLGNIDTELGRYGGTNGYLSSAAQNLNYNLTDINNSIKDMNSRLDDRQAALYNEYSNIQAQLMSLSYLQQTMSSLYGTTSTTA